MRIFRLPSCTAFGARLLAAVLLGLTVLGGLTACSSIASVSAATEADRCAVYRALIAGEKVVEAELAPAVPEGVLVTVAVAKALMPVLCGAAS